MVWFSLFLIAFNFFGFSLLTAHDFRRRSSTRGIAAATSAFIVILSSLPLAADYTITVNKSDDRGVWEGWGCSLSWWGQGVGNSEYQDLHADLLFTTKTVTYLGQRLPGLGLTIVRYNIGGGGRGEAIGGAVENVAPDLPWYKDIDGYWVNGPDRAPAPESWDWARDPNQRGILRAACARGVTWVEFFSAAPMWWMTDTRSSNGGRLERRSEADFAWYLASVVKHAQSDWGLKVRSIAPFNEPSAWWWKYPIGQEGCIIPKEQQRNVVGHLRAALEAQGLGDVQIAASDENSMKEAEATYEHFKGQRASTGRRTVRVSELVGKINVHAYSGQKPWRDNDARVSLRRAAGAKRIWITEYGDNDGSGMELARTILEDLSFLRPRAWLYWQPVEPYSTWGLVNAAYHEAGDMKGRGAPKWVYWKYHVFAQFTRFLREGHRILGSDDPRSVVAFDEAGKRLILITLNDGGGRVIRYDLSAFAALGGEASVTFTRSDGKALLSTTSLPVRDKSFTVDAAPGAVYSIVIDGAGL